jgi:hypothetical protein
MEKSKAHEEIKRIESELDAKSPPPGKPPAKQRGSGSNDKSDAGKNQSMDAVMIGVVMLLGIAATFALGERLNSTQKTQLGAGAVGAAAGLAIGYGVGRFRP